ncbi:MAG: sigma-70 family RNA polymerase sigma factor [Pseudomonadales bacterium]
MPTATQMDAGSDAIPDEALMLALQQGEEQAFESLLQRHLDSIHRYLLRQLGNAADADELSQETFTRLWTQASRFNPAKARLSTWLHRIAHNLMVDRLRGQRTVSVADVDDHATTEILDSERHDSISDAQLEWLNLALAELPAQQKAALALVYLQGFSNKEAALIMDIGLRALESLLARGRRTLHSKAGESAQ